jgi:transcription initiation factor IIE alpha subunit
MGEEARKLIEMVKKGVPDKEIMDKLGIQTKASLRKMYYDALVEAGKIKDILTEREAGTRKTLKITKRGTLMLSKALVIDKLGFNEGDRFSVSKRKESIILRKIDKE